MWCNHCQQDVPGVATMGKTAGAEIRCARCGRLIVTKPACEDGPKHNIGIADHGPDLDGSDLNAPDIDRAALIIAGTARNMGIEVVD